MDALVTCLDAPQGRHSWTNTGLDVVNGVLCSTRRCVWCGTEQHAAYSSAATRRPPWHTTVQNGATL